MNWCITHECYTEFPLGLIHKCLVVACGPDKLEDNWIDFVSEPSAEELAQMEQSALELRAQFE